MAKNIVILGYGPLVADGVARKFAEKGFTLVLVSRTKAKLDEAVADFQAKGVTAHAYAADFSKTDETIEVLRRITADVGNIDVLVFNGKPHVAEGILAASPESVAAFVQSTLVTLIAAIQVCSFSRRHTHTLTLTHTHTHTHTLTLTHTHTHSLTITHSHHSLTHSHTFSPTTAASTCRVSRRRTAAARSSSLAAGTA
jgi:NAD(P)-dependent dehydrogenase (short-subunit alcohol dehydrogenase family)